MQSDGKSALLTRPVADSVRPDSTKQSRFTCICCHAKFDSVELQKSHFKTEWHTYNLKRKVCRLEPIDLDNFQCIQSTNQVKPIEHLDVNKARVPRLDHQQNKASQLKCDEEDWDDLDGDEDEDEDLFLDEDYTEDEVQEMLARLIGSTRCLFCDFKSATIKSNIEHMNASHGFFIPEEQYLIDLEGLMEYLGFKVGAGCTCIWCNKQFSTLHGVRLHMLYKDHTRICYDQDKAPEFKEFYDYTEQEQIPMKPLNQLVISRKAVPSKRNLNRKTLMSKQSISSKHQLTKANGLILISGTDYRLFKKFNAERAKTLLRTQMANNNTMRGRIRIQNPM